MLYSANEYGNTVVELTVKGTVKNLNVEFETFGMQLLSQCSTIECFGTFNTSIRYYTVLYCVVVQGIMKKIDSMYYINLSQIHFSQSAR